MISSSSPGAGSLVVVDQHKKSSLCSVNTEFQDANILPDLNIAHVPSSSDEEQQRDGDGDGDRRFLLDKRGDGATVESNKGVGNHGEALDGNHDEYGDRGSAREQGDELQRPAMAVTVSEMPAPSWLPEGWVSESRIRADGHKDKYYIESYTGRRFRSKVEVFKYLETGLPPARWKRKGKGFDAGSNDKLDDPASFEQQQRDAIFGSAGAGFRVSTSASDTFKASFDGLRGSATINGITPPPFSMQRGSLDVDEQATKKPVFFDYWSSTLGSGSAPPRSSSSWTENYKLGTAFVNGPSPPSTAPSFGSKTESSTTPHWLDRILNKPPPAAIAQPGYSFGLTGGFVQSPLHYLQNAGAFQNNWLNLKPPTAINLSDYDVPWKSRSWFDQREPDSRGGGINLNHEPEEEARGQYHRHQAADRQEYSRRTNSSSLESLWKKAVPITLEHREYVAYSNGSNAGAAARPSKASGSHQQHHQHQHQHHQLHQHQHHQQHQHQHQHHPQHHQNQHPQQQREGGVKRSGAKVDRYQEKKRLERLGTRLCEQGLARLVHELKDRGRGIDLN